MKFNKIVYLLMIMVSFTACHDDIEDENQIRKPGDPFTPTVIGEVTGDVLGYIYNEAGEPLSGVLVSYYDGTTTTNDEGLFVFSDAKLDPNGTYIKASKEGYILGSDLVYPLGNVSYSYIKMLALNNSGENSLIAEEGGTVAVDGGGQLTFPPNAIVTPSGDPYNGRFTVTAKRISVDDPNLVDVMPGGLYGRAASGNNVVLATLGMMAVELRDVNGAELQVAPDKEVQITFPIAASIEAVAPDDVPLWSFDEVEGLWIEEGTAIRQGDQYVANVSHFSFWNCDAPFELVQVCGSVVFVDGTPAAGLYVQVSVNGLGTTSGMTDDQGMFCGKMPKNAVLQLSVRANGCQDKLAELEFGPFSENTTLDPIVVQINSPFQVSGRVECMGVPLEDALILITSGPYKFFAISDGDGTYSFTVDNQICNLDPTFEVFAINRETMEGSETQTFDSGSNQEEVILEVCSDCTFNAVINAAPDPCNGETGTLSVNILAGASNYTFEWDNGSTGVSRDYVEIGAYRVTVTDETGNCVQIATYTVEEDTNKFRLESDIVNTGCGDFGSIELFPRNGTMPFTYTWSGDISLGPITDPVLSDLRSGTYTVVVQDAEGCMIEETFTLVEGVQLTAELYNACQEQVYCEVFGGTPPYTYLVSIDGQVVSTDPFIERIQAGEYCVEVVDAEGCMTTVCEFFDIYEPLDFDANYDCTDTALVFSNLNPNFEYTFRFAVTPEITINNQVEYRHNPITNGYTLTAIVQDFQSGCQEVYFIDLPKLENIDILEATNGLIEAQATGTCTNCTPIGPYIYAEGELEVDLTANNGNLTPGDYVIVFRDELSNCIVGHKVVTLTN